MSRISNIIIAMTCVAVMLTATGCSGGFFAGRGGQMETYKFRSGTEGVSAEFVESMPPNEVFVGTEFSVAVKLKNKGAYSIAQNANLQIIPTDPTAFILPEGDTEPFELGGKSLYIREGDEDVITFPIKAACFRGFDGTRDSPVKNIDTKIEAKICYGYETEANADICIDTQHHQRRPNEKVACKMEDANLGGGQGGPVGVTKIKVQPPLPQGEKVLLQLPITIQKVGGKDVTIFSPDVSDCTQFDKQDDVEVSVTLGGTPMRCEPSTIELRARVDEPNLLCQAQLDPGLGAYKTPISINMRYHVSHSKLKDIKVEAPPGEVSVDCESLRAD